MRTPVWFLPARCQDDQVAVFNRNFGFISFPNCPAVDRERNINGRQVYMDPFGGGVPLCGRRGTDRLRDAINGAI